MQGSLQQIIVMFFVVGSPPTGPISVNSEISFFGRLLVAIHGFKMVGFFHVHHSKEIWANYYSSVVQTIKVHYPKVGRKECRISHRP